MLRLGTFATPARRAVCRLRNTREDSLATAAAAAATAPGTCTLGAVRGLLLTQRTRVCNTFESVTVHSGGEALSL